MVAFSVEALEFADQQTPDLGFLCDVREAGLPEELTVIGQLTYA